MREYSDEEKRKLWPESDVDDEGEEIGLDLSEHRATRVDAEVLTNASLVYAMEIEHVDWLRSLLPDAPVGLLGSAAIDDPYGSNLLEYRRACRAVVAAVQMRVPEMIVLAG